MVVAHGCVQCTQNLEVYSAFRHVSMFSHMTLIAMNIIDKMAAGLGEQTVEEVGRCRL